MGKKAVEPNIVASVFSPVSFATPELEQDRTQHCQLFLRARTPTWYRDNFALSWPNTSCESQVSASESKEIHIPSLRSKCPAAYSGVRGQAAVVLFLCSELNIQDILRESPHLVKIVLSSVPPTLWLPGSKPSDEQLQRQIQTPRPLKPLYTTVDLKPPPIFITNLKLLRGKLLFLRIMETLLNIHKVLGPAASTLASTANPHL